MATLPRRLFTQEEYLALEAKSQQKHELYRGEIFAMPGASQSHNLITSNTHGRLFQQLEGKPCRAMTSDVLVKVGATGLISYPDISVACDPIEHEPAAIEVILNPKVLVEVLSPSTELYDRNIKFRHYQQIPSVQEILLVRQDEMLVEHYRRASGDSWLLTTVRGPEGVITLESIACRLPLPQIYDRVEFPPPAPPPPLPDFLPPPAGS